MAVLLAKILLLYVGLTKGVMMFSMLAAARRWRSRVLPGDYGGIRQGPDRRVDNLSRRRRN